MGKHRDPQMACNALWAIAQLRYDPNELCPSVWRVLWESVESLGPMHVSQLLNVAAKTGLGLPQGSVP